MSYSTSDQYTPNYSDLDYDTYSSDYSMVKPHLQGKAPPQTVYSHEKRYQAEQQGIPTYMPCAPVCVQDEWPDRSVMRKKTVSERTNDMLEDSGFVKAKYQGPLEAMTGGMIPGDTSPMIMILLVLFIFLIAYFCKVANDLKWEIRMLKMIMSESK